jgi:hypothetical protein
MGEKSTLRGVVKESRKLRTQRAPPAACEARAEPGVNSVARAPFLPWMHGAFGTAPDSEEGARSGVSGKGLRSRRGG